MRIEAVAFVYVADRARRPTHNPTPVLHCEQMSNTLTIRLSEDLSDWLDETSRKTGVPRGQIIRQELERARRDGKQPFLSLAGAVDGPRDLSQRKGFSDK